MIYSYTSQSLRVSTAKPQYWMVFIEYIFKCSIYLLWLSVYVWYILIYSSTIQSLSASTAKHQCNVAAVCHCIFMQCKVFIRFCTCSFSQLWTRLQRIAGSKHQSHCIAMYSKFLIHTSQFNTSDVLKSYYIHSTCKELVIT